MKTYASIIVAVGIFIVCYTDSLNLQLQAQSTVQGIASSLGNKSFEVVSVKPRNANEGGTTLDEPCGGSTNFDPQFFRASNVTAYGLITLAFGDNNCVFTAQHKLLSGGPKWISTERFDLQTVFPEGSQNYKNYQLSNLNGVDIRRDASELQMMIRTMLEDRFQLVIHSETKEMPTYDLIVAEGGPKLRRSDGSCVEPGSVPAPIPASVKFCHGSRLYSKGSRIGDESNGVTILWYFNKIGMRLDRPVIDQTGITAAFDFYLEFTPDDRTPGYRLSVPSDDPPGPSIFTAVQEQLGLRLEPTKGHVKTLVIDRIERPVPNLGACRE